MAGRSKDPRVRKLNALVARNLQKARVLRDLSQPTVARKSGFAADQIAKWERGEKAFEIGVLKILADVYEWPVDHFFMDPPPWSPRIVAPTGPTSPPRNGR